MARRGHALAGTLPLGWAQAAAHPWVLPPPGTALRGAIDASFIEHGLAPPVPWLESASVTVTVEALRRTDCLGVLSGAVAAQHRALAPLGLRLACNIGPVGMMWADREPGPALALVLQALRDCACGPLMDG
jgi:DNA-binding transcriptional LysR family regulator